MVSLLLLTFQAVSIIFALSAVGTGIQSIVDPVGFSKFFGLPVAAAKNKDQRDAHTLAQSYIALMGVRQLATGLTLLCFAYQGNWQSVATILAIIGIVVAGTDGLYLARANGATPGLFHALPGALISALAGAVIYYKPTLG